MPETPAAPLRLTVDTGALQSNWKVLDRMSGNASAGAAVKADAYCVGITQAVPALLQAGCSSFFVAHWREAQALLAYMPGEQISVLHGPLNEADARFAIGNGIKPVINSLHQAKLWLNAGGGICDVMIDTGINRLGLSLDETSDALLQQLDIDVLMSHLASADEDSPMNRAQLERFMSAAGSIKCRKRSLANSAGIALGSDYSFDLTRPGLALYGGIPRGELADQIKPVVKIDAAILQTRILQAGESVGYNAAFTAPASMRVGTVSLGYADGYLRSWAGKGVLRSGADDLPVLGKVSMDMVVVDLSNAPHCQDGDWLEVPYYLPQAAQQSGLSQYELLTILGRRFDR